MTEIKKNPEIINEGTKAKRKTKGLGRGLEALFETESYERKAEPKSDRQEVVMIDINELVPNRAQPRKYFDSDKLNELAESIKDQGLIQPLIVAVTENSKAPYMIVAGERRWRAARQAGLTELPCLLRKMDDLTMQQHALIENVVREDLNAIEEAKAYEDLTLEYGITQETLARALGRSRSAISNTVRLLQLSNIVQTYISEGKISAGHARALLSLSPAEQERCADLIIEKDLSVRDTEAMVKQILNPPPAKKAKKEITNAYDLHTKAAEDKMSRAMGAKVRIKAQGKKGNIIISYTSKDELERLIDNLSK